MFGFGTKEKKVEKKVEPIDWCWLIKKYEGCELKAYKCPAGVNTIGYGTTIYPDGKKVCMGDKITLERASECLLLYVEQNIDPVLSGMTLSSNQRIALYSLIYNIGSGAFNKSLLKKAILAKDWGQVCQSWVSWNKAGGKVLKGLVKRRAEELGLFIQDI